MAADTGRGPADPRHGSGLDIRPQALDPADLDALVELLQQPDLGPGPWVEQVEGALAAYLEARRAIATGSAIGAFRLVLAALGVGPDDEVLIPAVAPLTLAQAVFQVGAGPILADVDPATGLVDPGNAGRRISGRTRVLVAVHVSGQLADLESLRTLTTGAGAALVEDAGHGLEGRHRGLRPGQISLAACLSFSSPGAITCGEGGAIVTRDEELADRIRVLGRLGQRPRPRDRKARNLPGVDVAGPAWDERLDDLRAAILRPQLERLDELRTHREAIARECTTALAAVPGIAPVPVLEGAVHARRLLPVLVPPGRRPAILRALRDAGIPATVAFPSLTRYTVFREYFRDETYPGADAWGDGVVSLPLPPRLAGEGRRRFVDLVVTSFRTRS